MDMAVFKAFAYDLLTTVISLAVGWLAYAEHWEVMGLSPALAPIAAALVGALAIGLRRYKLIKSA